MMVFVRQVSQLVCECVKNQVSKQNGTGCKRVRFRKLQKITFGTNGSLIVIHVVVFIIMHRQNMFNACSVSQNDFKKEIQHISGMGSG